MNRLMSLMVPTAALLLAACATPQQSATASMASQNANPVAPATTCDSANTALCAGSTAAGSNPVSPTTLCAASEGCEQQPQAVARGEEIGIEKNAPPVEGHPLTSVVVTQCNMVVAVYMTMPDGRFLRFDQRADVPAEQLVGMAYTAKRSERVEVSCDGLGAAGFEKHDAV